MYKPLLKGDIRIDTRGVAFCSGQCEIGTSEITNSNMLTTAFSFEFCSINLNCNPNILFGIKQGESIVLQLDYFGILRTIRSVTVTPHIPSDGLGVSIHLLVSENQISLYVNEILQSQKYSLDSSNFSFFLSFNSISAIVLTPFSSVDLPRVFFPDLQPHLWDQLPFHVSIRGFNIKSSSDSNRNIFSEEELQFLPGIPKIRYFEVIYRSVSEPKENSKGGIGLVEQPRASADYPPGFGFHSIGFFTKDKSLYVNSSNELTITGKEQVKSGSVVGIGIQSNSGIFATFNGRRVNQSLISIPPLRRFFPVVTTNGVCDEVMINLGELPFSYSEINPPFGWCLFCAPKTNPLFQKGPPNESHLLHFFPFTCHSQRHSDGFLGSEQVCEGCRFEVTLVKMKSDDIVAIGFSDQNFNCGDMVGWSQRSIGIHSEDGNCFFEDDSNPTKIFDPRLVSEGKTIGIVLDKKSITYTIDAAHFPVMSNYQLPTFPTMTVEGPVAIIANFGESPFAGVEHDNCEEGTKIFNGRRVKMANENLDIYGLSVGDEVECRDLSFRGHFAGELNGRLYFNVNGIDGAVPLDTTEPALVSSLIRVTKRKSDAPFLQPLLTFDSVVINNVSFREKHRLFASCYGLAVLCGYSPYFSQAVSQNQTSSKQSMQNQTINDKALQLIPSSSTQKPSHIQTNSKQDALQQNSFNIAQKPSHIQTNSKQDALQQNSFNIAQKNSQNPLSSNQDASQQNPFNKLNINLTLNSNSLTPNSNASEPPSISRTHIAGPKICDQCAPSRPTLANPHLFLRPVFDLMNNFPSFSSSNGAVNILELNKIVPVFKTSGVKFMDVVSDSERNVLLMLGSQNGTDVGWNNVSIVPLKGKPKIVFRFYGFALKKIQNHSPALVNVGNRKGGELFLPNYQGTNGSSFFQHSTTQKSFGSRGFSLLPPIVQQLICSLNDHFYSKLNELKTDSDEKSDISKIIYSTHTHIVKFYCNNLGNAQEIRGDDEQNAQENTCDINNVALITETNYMRLK